MALSGWGRASTSLPGIEYYDCHAPLLASFIAGRACRRPVDQSAYAGGSSQGDGKPILTAPAPKTQDGKPDLSGMWVPRDERPCDPKNGVVQCAERPLTPQLGNFALGLKDGLPYQPWAADLVKTRSKEAAFIDPHTHCMPINFPRAWAYPETEKIFQTPGQLVILHEFNASYRQIFSMAASFRKTCSPPGTVIRWLTGKAPRWWWNRPAIATIRGWIRTATSSRVKRTSRNASAAPARQPGYRCDRR